MKSDYEIRTLIEEIELKRKNTIKEKISVEESYDNKIRDLENQIGILNGEIHFQKNLKRLNKSREAIRKLIEKGICWGSWTDYGSSYTFVKSVRESFSTYEDPEKKYLGPIDPKPRFSDNISCPSLEYDEKST